MSTTTALLQSTLTSVSDRPIFSRQRVAHHPPHPVTHLVTSNLQVVLVLANKSLQRINLSSKRVGTGADVSGGEAPMEMVDFSKACPHHSKVSSAFLDPLGSHLLLSLRPTGASDPGVRPELLYLNRRSQKPRVVTKARGNLVTAVAWSPSNASEAVTEPILLGTTKGVIFECELDSGGEERILFSGGSNPDKYWRMAYDLGRGQHFPITGLAYYSNSASEERSNRLGYFVLVTTANRLYQFVGMVGGHEDRPLLTHVFAGDQHLKFLELPSTLKTSTLSFFHMAKEQSKPAGARHPLFPVSFGWLTEPGIYHGKIDPAATSGSGGTVTVDCQLMPMPQQSSPVELPQTFLLTEFHAVIAYSHCVKGICLLNEQVVFNSEFDPDDDKLKGMSRDPISGNFFVFSDYAVYKFRVDREKRNVWRIYLERGEFDLAQQFCRDDPDKLDEVFTRRAQDLFEKGCHVESAMHFAKTKCSFEEIALKFMQVEEKSALLNYLKKRLELVNPTTEKTQLTLIVVWLIENYLSRIRALGEISGGRSNVTNDQSAAKKEAQTEFLNLLCSPKVASCLDQSKSAVYDLLASHGDSATLVAFASHMGDFDKVIRCHLQSGEFKQVLTTLREQRRPEFYYRYGPDLMHTLPKDFVDLLIADRGDLLSPTKVLPALVVSSREDQELQAIRYLEFVVGSPHLRRRDPALHNFLISLYVKHRPEKLENYLLAQGFSPDDVPYDVEYTLRLLLGEKGLARESIVVYCVLGQLEEAVELALTVEDDPELAQKRCLPLAPDDDGRRKIWLRIARHVVEKKNDVRQAMEYLKRSGDLVKVEDVLPFFPDFVTIDHFKDAICDSLQEYSEHIEELRTEMEECNKSADTIREEIQHYKNRYIFVRAVDSCCVCSGHLMSRPFHLFTCGHRMHTSCLMEQVRTYLTPARRKKLEELLNDLQSVTGGKEDTVSVDSRTAKLSRKEQLRSEIDDLIAYECLFCGDIMVKMVDRPLIEDENFELEMRDWL